MKRERSLSRAAESPSSKRSRSSTPEEAFVQNPSPKVEESPLDTSQSSVSGGTISSAASDKSHGTTATAPTIDTFVPEKVAFPLLHKHGVAYATKKNNTPEGYFYKGTVLPMAVGDVVARIRDPNDIKDGFMRNEWDLVDGLYRLEKFHAAVGNTTGNDSAATKKRKKGFSAEELEEDETNRKLSKKAKLTYPKLHKPKHRDEDWFQTAGEQWVTLGDLRPALLQTPPGSTIVANNLSVSNMEAFTLLKSEPNIIHQQVSKHSARADDIKEATEPICESKKNNDSDEKTKDEDTIPAAEETKKSANITSQSKAYSSKKEKPMYFVHLKDTTYAAITEIPGVFKGKATWEVEKLRGKRVLIYKPDHEDVTEEGLTTEVNDPWVKKLLEEKPGWCKNKIVVTEYLVHYAGWPDEDDEWEFSVNKSSRVTSELKADFAPTAAQNLAAAKHLSDWVRRGPDNEYQSEDEEENAKAEVQGAAIESAKDGTVESETVEAKSKEGDTTDRPE